MLGGAEECPHGDLPESCPPCQSAHERERQKVIRGETGATFFGDRNRATMTRTRTPRAIVARFDGECPECGSDIVSGETAIAKDDHDETWKCAECMGAAL